MAKHLDDPNTQSNSESRELAKDQPKLLAIVDCPPELGPVPDKNGTRLAGPRPASSPASTGLVATSPA
jgi:hypothetical protein